jgi:hypothetical protein
MTINNHQGARRAALIWINRHEFFSAPNDRH